MSEMGWHWKTKQSIAAIDQAIVAAPTTMVHLLNPGVSKIRR